MKIGDRVKIIRSHRGDFEGMVGELIEIKGDDLKYHVKMSENFSCWARKIAVATEYDELIFNIIEWWKIHQFDVESGYDEGKIYDSEPEFVTLAKKLQ